MPKVCAGRQERDGAEHYEELGRQPVPRRFRVPCWERKDFIGPPIISVTAEIPFVLVLIGVLGGVLAFGLIGLFLGPIALAVLLPVWEWAEQLDARGSRETT